MDNNFSEFEELLEALTGPVVLAVFGGVARACRYGIKSWRQFCGNMVISAFTGVIVHLMLQETSFPASTQAAIVAASGYSGGAILDAIASGIIHQFKHLSNEKNQGDNNGQEKH